MTKLDRTSMKCKIETCDRFKLCNERDRLARILRRRQEEAIDELKRAQSGFATVVRIDTMLTILNSRKDTS